MLHALVLLISFSAATFADLDPDQRLLLRPGADVERSPDDLDPSLYTVLRPKKSARPSVVPLDRQPESVTPSASEPSESRPLVEPSLPATREIDSIGESASPISLALAPAFYAAGAASSYGPRRFGVSAPGLQLDAAIWANPSWGLNAHYFTTIGARAHGAQGQASAFSAQDLALGVRWKKTYADAEVSFGVDYHQSQDKFSHDAAGVLGHSTMGPRLAFELAHRISTDYTNTFVLGLEPYLFSEETSSEFDARSGHAPYAQGLNVSFGGRWRVSSEDHVFWRTEARFEHTTYSGSASAPDPSTGTTPSHVDVNETSATVSLGFSWGS